MLFIQGIAPADSLGAVAVYADAQVNYGKVVEVLNLGAEASVKMVLATKPASLETSAQESAQENTGTPQ